MPASLIGVFVNSKETFMVFVHLHKSCLGNSDNLMVFVHLHKSCLGNSDNLILSMKTGNAHKERTLSPTIINTFKKCKGEEGI